MAGVPAVMEAPDCGDSGNTGSKWDTGVNWIWGTGRLMLKSLAPPLAHALSPHAPESLLFRLKGNDELDLTMTELVLRLGEERVTSRFAASVMSKDWSDCFCT